MYTDSDDPADVPLTNEGNPPARCGCLEECAGDCDSDADCVGDLVCYFRSEGDGIPPGCSGEVHEPNHDYCYDPAKADPSAPGLCTMLTIC